tara:strand:- start:386 stop:574 length:189 start_codon:yes stop_codon:yes gene_type:complete
MLRGDICPEPREEWLKCIKNAEKKGVIEPEKYKICQYILDRWNLCGIVGKRWVFPPPGTTNK